MSPHQGDARSIWVVFNGAALTHHSCVIDAGTLVPRDVGAVDNMEGACSYHALFAGPCGAFTNSLAQTAKFIGVEGVPRLVETRVPSELFVLK